MSANRIMRITSRFLLILSSVIYLSCGGKHGSHEDSFIVHGKLKNSNAEKIFLLQLKVDSLKPIDSIQINEDGEFTFTYKPKEISFYLLQLSKDNFITLLLDKGDQTEITGNARQFANEYQVSGSHGSELLWLLNYFTRENYRKTDSLIKVQDMYKNSDNFIQIKLKHDSIFQQIFKEQQTYVKDFIKTHSQSLASLIALYQFFGRQKVLNERDHFNYFKLLDSTLSLVYPQNDYVLELHQRVVNVETAKKEKLLHLAKLDSGMVAPNIQMKNIGGVLQTLSSLKGRPVLVFFWAATSNNCIRVLPQFKWLHKTYRSKGFEIYAVSLDDNRYLWENAVRQHKLNWVHVSDLLGWNSPVVTDYCLDYIPFAVLIDRTGNILKRGIGQQELASFLYKTYKFRGDTTGVRLSN